MIQQPLPFEIPYSILLDASGNGSYTQQFGNDFWYSATISGLGQGNPTWAVTKNKVFLQPGLGPSVVLPASICSPGTQIVISISNGIPSTTVTGMIYGVKSSRAENLPPQLSTAQSQITSSAVYPRQRLYPDGVIPSATAVPPNPSFSVPPGPLVTKRFTLPPNTVSIRLLAQSNGLLFNYLLLITGVQSSEQYFGSEATPGSPTGVGSPTLPVTFPIETDWDRQIDISILPDVSNTVNFYVSALFAPESPGQAGSAQSVVNTFPSNWQAGVIRATITATSVASGGTLNIIPAQGSTRITVLPHRYEFFQDGANAAGRWTLRDTLGQNINDMFCNNVRGRFADGTLEGIGVQASAGIEIVNGGAAASFFGGFLDYNLQIG